MKIDVRVEVPDGEDCISVKQCKYLLFKCDYCELFRVKLKPANFNYPKYPSCLSACAKVEKSKITKSDKEGI